MARMLSAEAGACEEDRAALQRYAAETKAMRAEIAELKTQVVASAGRLTKLRGACVNTQLSFHIIGGTCGSGISAYIVGRAWPSCMPPLANNRSLRCAGACVSEQPVWRNRRPFGVASSPFPMRSFVQPAGSW